MPVVELDNIEVTTEAITSQLTSFTTYDITGLTSIIGESLYKKHKHENVLADYRRAILKYSMDFPQRIVDDLVLTENEKLSYPNRFVKLFSKIISIKLNEIDVSYSEYTDNENKPFLILNEILAGQIVRMTYTTIWDYSILQLHQRLAINYLTAAFICESMSIKSIGDTNHLGVSGEAKNINSKLYSDKAQQLRNEYYNLTGLPSEKKNTIARGVIVGMNR